MPDIELPADGEKPYGNKLRTAINAINDAVDAATEAIADGSAVTDSAVTALVANPGSDTRAELNAAIAGSTRAAQSPVWASQARRGADFFHTFTNKPDHVMADGDLADSGHLFTVRENTMPPFRVSGGALTRTPQAGGVYLGVKLDGTAAVIGCRYVIPEGAGTPDTLTLIASKLEFTAASDATGYSVAASHTNIGQQGISYQTLDSNPPEYNFNARTILTYDHPNAPLPPGEYVVEIDLRADRASIRTPNGDTIFTPVDAKIASQNGPWLTWELFASASGTKALRILDIWASTDKANGLDRLAYDRTLQTVSGSVAGLTVSNVQATSVSLSWQATPGATRYIVSKRALGGDWEVVATTASTSAVVTGLTSATNYEFAVRPAAAVIATTAGTPTVYAADDFNRADGALGNTPTGSLAWTVNGGSISVKSNQMWFDTVTSATTRAYALVNTGQSNGRISLRLNANLEGLAFRCVAGTSGYLLQISGSQYQLLKRTASGTYTQVATTGDGWATVGQAVSVLLDGPNMTFFYENGNVMFTYSDTQFQSATLHGAASGFNNRGADDFAHTSA